MILISQTIFSVKFSEWVLKLVFPTWESKLVWCSLNDNYEWTVFQIVTLIIDYAQIFIKKINDYAKNSYIQIKIKYKIVYLSFADQIFELTMSNLTKFYIQINLY